MVWYKLAFLTEDGSNTQPKPKTQPKTSRFEQISSNHEQATNYLIFILVKMARNNQIRISNNEKKTISSRFWSMVFFKTRDELKYCLMNIFVTDFDGSFISVCNLCFIMHFMYIQYNEYKILVALMDLVILYFFFLNVKNYNYFINKWRINKRKY